MSRSIPEQLVKSIQPAREHPVDYSHIYTFQDDKPQSSDSIYVKLPYSANVYWTHFSYNWIGQGAPQFELYWREKGKNLVELKCQPSGKDNTWISFEWPLPAVHTRDDTGFYLRVFYPEISFAGFLQIDFLGFEELLPYNKTKLILCDSDNAPLYTFQTFDRYYQYYYFTHPDHLVMDGRDDYVYIQTQQNYIKPV